METKFKVGQVVKYSRPEPGEEDFRFFVNEIHPQDGNLKEKLHIELICENILKATFCHFSDEYVPSSYRTAVEYKGQIVESECFGRL